MNDRTSARDPRPADSHPRLRLTALVAVITGVMLLAAAAFVFSYAGIHQIALAAGVSPALARLYPVIFDVMLVIAFAATLALRGAGWWTRCYVWACTLLLLAAVAAGNAARAMDLALPRKPAAAAVAVIPWALLLLAFGFLLAMLRRLRRGRAQAASGGAAGTTPAGGGLGNGTAFHTGAPPTGARYNDNQYTGTPYTGTPYPSASNPGAVTGGTTQGGTANGGPAGRLTLDALLDPRPGAAAPSLGNRLPAAPPSPRPALPASPAGQPPETAAADRDHDDDEDDLDSPPVAYENLASDEQQEADPAGGPDEPEEPDGTVGPGQDHEDTGQQEDRDGRATGDVPAWQLERPRSSPTPPGE